MARLERTRKFWMVVLGLIAVGSLTAAVAVANPGNAFFHPLSLVTGTQNDEIKLNSDRVKLQTKGPADVRVQLITFDAGGASGWHHHPGFVIATVKTGTVTFTRDCKSTDYGPGSVFVESGDSPGQASSTNGATVYATFVAPHVDATAGGPVFRIEDDPPSCP
jgi:quercetin dioxygenase-like cupin family protein